MIKLLIFTVQTKVLSLYSACCYYAQFVCHSMMTGLIKSSCNNHAVKLQLVPHMNFMAVWFCLVQFRRMSTYGYLQCGKPEHHKPLHLHRTEERCEHHINNGGILSCSIGEISHFLWVFFPTIEMVLSDLSISTKMILYQMTEANWMHSPAVHFWTRYAKSRRLTMP